MDVEPEGVSPAAPAVITVLVVDDEPAFHQTIARYLRPHRVLNAYNAPQALEKLSKHHVDVVLLDINMPGMSGLELVGKLHNTYPDLEIIVVTSHITIDNAVRAVKHGAFDFLAKSYDNYQQLGAHIDRALRHRQRRRADSAERTDESASMDIIENSTSPKMREIAVVIRKVAQTPLTVLIEGESGVGKEFLARYLHMYSDRSEHTMLAVNLAATPDSLLEAALFGHEKGAFTGADRQRLGKFELADKSTLFLDEIGEIGANVQAKVLRCIQECEVERIGAAEPSPVDVRLVVATNQDLEQKIAAGEFREDLWYRLNVVRVCVPPLRERPDDIPALVHILTERATNLLKRPPVYFTSKSISLLQSYSWPGNVRELENLIMRLVALHPGEKVRAIDIPIEYCVQHLGKLASKLAARQGEEEGASLYRLATRQFERYFVKHVIDRCFGNMAEASRQLGISYTTVKNKVYDSDLSSDEDLD